MFPTQSRLWRNPGASDKRLDSFSFSFFEQCWGQLAFRHNFNLEASEIDPNVGFDGGVLELSTDGGITFRDILTAGGSFVMGGYNRTISADRGSPIAGRQAWSGNSNGFIATVVNLPTIQTVGKLRWRLASDNSGSGEGWRIDTIEISSCGGGTPCPQPRPTPAPRPVPHTSTPTATGTPSPTPTPSATPRVTPRPSPTPAPRP